MKGVPNGLSRFGRRLLHPRSWPVRWRLATVSAGLTLLILLLFGGAIGQIATQRIRNDFNNEVRSATRVLASELQISYPPFQEPQLEAGPQLKSFVRLNEAAARVYDLNGNVIESTRPPKELGRPIPGAREVNGMRVATERIVSKESGEITGYVQYGRSTSHVEDTIDRVWLLIAAGILGGTLLAVLAGVAIAGRAMRPIASLTATARKIAATRDPSERMPEPSNDDEVGELARTLEQMLRSLDAARAEREGVMQKQREFVADASHELRTPLTSVLANLELLQASLRSDDQAEDREIVDSALRSSKRMGRLIADLLLLARADAGRLPAHHRVDLAEIAGDAAAEVAPLMGGRELIVDNEKPLRVEGSRDELHRMVLNLLDNAIRHTPSSSCVELKLLEKDGEAVVEVADDGPGIPEAMRTQVFDRFVRGTGPADTARGTGTGLGLAIVGAVAESHGGTVVAAESRSGGALFVARIPLAERPKPAAKPLEAL
ncbi:MAG TPA: HAMP domain-containing sensor histidine kinase [Solirubrobacterales bacterium]|nr:HAMP domain-containing sensor histidine kinase [Solirubrobacterales bacterium]